MNTHSYTKSKLNYQNKQGSKSQASYFSFTPTQILTNQILKVLKLRLIISNIHIPEEKLIELIKDNLSLIDIQYFKVSSLNIFVDDLIKIIKEDTQQQGKNDKIVDESKQGSFTRTTILSFKRKVYADTHNVPISQKLSKIKKISTIPMRFNLDNKSKPDEFDFYLDDKKEITTLNDCDLEEVQEKIVNEIANDTNDKNNFF